MKQVRLMAAVSLTVGLFVSACSQAPAEVAGGLEAQFGTFRGDQASVLTTDTQRGRIYLGGSSNDDSDAQNTVVFFRSYTRNGSLVWEINANTARPNVGASVTDVVTDRKGNVYFNWDTYGLNGDNSFTKGFISKYSPTGVRLFQKRLKNESLQGLASDASGNLYVTSDSNHVRKYSGSGELIWDKVIADENFPFGFGTIFGIDAAKDGSLYVGGGNGSGYGGLLFKLRSSDGKLVKTSRVRGDAAFDVKVAGDAIYVYSEVDVFNDPYVSKFRADGSQVWVRSGLVEEDENGNFDYESSSSLGVDTYGNAYLTGTFVDGSANEFDLICSQIPSFRQGRSQQTV